MPYLLKDLVVNRVDLVDAGANSAAFIEVFKRKEQEELMEFEEIISKMKPEHAAVVEETVKKSRDELEAANATIATQAEQLTTLSSALEKAKEDLAKRDEDSDCSCDGEADENGTCKACGKPKKKSASFDEAEVLKAMPEALRTEYTKMKAQKEAAEEQVRQAAEQQAEAKAVAKAAELKALPVDQSTLVGILKSCDQSIVDILSAAAAAVEGTVLSEVGKAGTDVSTGEAWDKIEAKATEVMKRDSVTKQRAIATVIQENPELYKEYLEGGAN